MIRQHAHRLAEPLARIGFVAKGVVYLTIGLLAAGAAFHLGGRTTNSQGVMTTVLRQPLGRTLLGLLAAGFAAYSLWNFYAAAFDAEQKGAGLNGIVERLGNAITGIGYGLLAAQAVRLIMGWRLTGDSAEEWTRRGLRTTHGVVLVSAVGLGIVIYGVVRLRVAFVSRVGRELGLDELDSTQHRVLIGLGRFGIAAQAIVAALIGAFVIKAAWSFDPDQVGGIADALAALRHHRLSPFVLGTIALGITAHGCYELVKSRYRLTRPWWPLSQR